MSEACIGCKSLRYNYKFIPYCVSLSTLRCFTIPKCPCMNCLVKVTCVDGCEKFEDAARAYENGRNEYAKDKYASGKIKRINLPLEWEKGYE